MYKYLSTEVEKNQILTFELLYEPLCHFLTHSIHPSLTEQHFFLYLSPSLSRRLSPLHAKECLYEGFGHTQYTKNRLKKRRVVKIREWLSLAISNQSVWLGRNGLGVPFKIFTARLGLFESPRYTCINLALSLTHTLSFSLLIWIVDVIKKMVQTPMLAIKCGTRNIKWLSI